MVVGATCDSGQQCCWVVSGSAELPVITGDGVDLDSKCSFALLRYYGVPVGHRKYTGKQGQLLDEAALYVLWAIAPGSFFLAYEEGSRLHSLSDVPVPFALPDFRIRVVDRVG